jgi:hypothetical protein
VSILKSIDWARVRGHYDRRIKVSKELQKLYDQKLISEFADLAVGISNASANYSATEHGLGPKILNANANAARRVFNLAREFRRLTGARRVPEIIRDAQIKYLQVGVGSEISCMVNPRVCWVANTRTVWTHLVIKHADDVQKADEELKLYRQADVASEMNYHMWAQLHAQLEVALTRIAELGNNACKKAKIVPGRIIYLWADAIASRLYGMHHD